MELRGVPLDECAVAGPFIAAGPWTGGRLKCWVTNAAAVPCACGSLGAGVVVPGTSVVGVTVDLCPSADTAKSCAKRRAGSQLAVGGAGGPRAPCPQWAGTSTSALCGEVIC